MGDGARFALIVLCFIISLSYGRRSADPSDALRLRLAMFFTVLADGALLVLHRHICGVALFCAVQYCYTRRYGGGRLAQPALALILFAVLALMLRLEPLYALAGAYAVCFGFSLFHVCRWFTKSPLPLANRALALGGMWAFAACDINVALYNSGLSDAVTSRAFLLIWVFYLPAQFMLALSGRRWAG